MKISKMQEYRKSLRIAFNGFIKNGLTVDNAYKTVKETAKNAYKGSEEAFETQFELAFKNVERVKIMKVEVKNIAKQELLNDLKNQIALQYDIILNADIDCIDEIMSENTFAIYHKKTGLRCNYERTKVETNGLTCMKLRDINGAKRISYTHCFHRFFELRTV